MKLEPVLVNDWHSSLSAILDDMEGRPLNVHGLMAHNPELLNAWWPYRSYIVSGGVLGRRKAELVILRVACHLNSWYEWASHVERAIACGITLEEIDRVKMGAELDFWEPGENALIQAVDDLSSNRRLSRETLQELGMHYSTAQIMDIVAIHGMYFTLGCMLNTWQPQLDAHVADKLPERVTQEEFLKSY